MARSGSEKVELFVEPVRRPSRSYGATLKTHGCSIVTGAKKEYVKKIREDEKRYRVQLSENVSQNATTVSCALYDSWFGIERNKQNLRPRDRRPFRANTTARNS